MTEVNPYSPPSMDSLRETPLVDPARLPSVTRVRWFVTLNRVVAGTMVGFGPFCALIGLALDRTFSREWQAVWFIASGMLTVWGLLQWRQFGWAIMSTGAAAGALFVVSGLAALLWYTGVLGPMRLPIVDETAIVVLGTFGTIFSAPPVWLGIQTWRWQGQGIATETLGVPDYSAIVAAVGQRRYRQNDPSPPGITGRN